MSESQDPAGRDRWDPLVDAEQPLTPTNMAPQASSDQPGRDDTVPALPEIPQ